MNQTEKIKMMHVMMNKVKLRTKLIGGFCFVALITLAVGLTGWKSTSDITAQLHKCLSFRKIILTN